MIGTGKNLIQYFPELIRLTLFACLGLLPICAMPASEGTSEAVLHWTNRLFVWHYNPANEPSWLKNGEALAMIREATEGWSACGVDLRYAGVSDKAPGIMDGENVIGWKNEGRAYSAWTSWQAKRSGQAIEADVTLYSNIYADYREKGVDAKLELRKSIIHELGHVLGLSHSTQLGDAMIVKIRTRPEWKLPSDNDIKRCQEIYSSR